MSLRILVFVLVAVVFVLISFKVGVHVVHVVELLGCGGAGWIVVVSGGLLEDRVGVFTTRHGYFEVERLL